MLEGRSPSTFPFASQGEFPQPVSAYGAPPPATPGGALSPPPPQKITMSVAASGVPIPKLAIGTAAAESPVPSRSQDSTPVFTS